MSRIYVLIPTAEQAKDIAQELTELGLSENRIHLLAKDSHAAEETHLHPASRVLISDALHMAKQGGLAGALVATVLVLIPGTGIALSLTNLTQAVLLCAAVGATVCSVIGLGRHETTIEEHADEINQGQIMLLADVPKHQRHSIEERIHKAHPQALIEEEHGALHL